MNVHFNHADPEWAEMATDINDRCRRMAICYGIESPKYWAAFRDRELEDMKRFGIACGTVNGISIHDPDFPEKIAASVSAGHHLKFHDEVGVLDYVTNRKL